MYGYFGSHIFGDIFGDKGTSTAFNFLESIKRLEKLNNLLLLLLMKLIYYYYILNLKLNLRNTFPGTYFTSRFPSDFFNG